MLSDSVRKFCLNTAVVVGASAAALLVSRGLQSERYSGTALAAVVSLPVAYAVVTFVRAARNATLRLKELERRVWVLETHPWLADHCRPEPVKLRTVHVTKDDPGSAA